MVGGGIRCPIHLTSLAIVQRINNAVVVIVVITLVTEQIPIMVPLGRVRHPRAVVLSIEDAVRISVGLVKPNANIITTVTGRAVDPNVRCTAEHECKQGGAVEGKG